MHKRTAHTIQSDAIALDTIGVRTQHLLFFSPKKIKYVRFCTMLVVLAVVLFGFFFLLGRLTLHSFNPSNLLNE